MVSLKSLLVLGFFASMTVCKTVAKNTVATNAKTTVVATPPKTQTFNVAAEKQNLMDFFNNI